MTQDFKNIMASKSDGELLEIITKLKDDYQPAAVEAAQQEFESRNLSSAQLERAEVQIKEKESIEIEKANAPLETGQKILFLLFFWGVLPWSMAGTFKAKGYIKKYKDAWKFMKIGALVFWGIPVLILIILSLAS